MPDAFDHATGGTWLFGYGSLIYKVDFPFLERRPAVLRGWARRFWQGSHDHRGTPDRPGRVATLVPEPGAVCHGVAYRIAPAAFAQLDVREKNGYARMPARLELAGGEQVEGVAYVAPPGNAAWLGDAGIVQMARHIAGAHGPSGSNRDYVLALADALHELGVEDPHVAALVAALAAADAEAAPAGLRRSPAA